MLQVEEYLELLDIDTERLGLVIGPRFDAEPGEVELEVNLRILDDEEAIYGVDGVFTYEMDWLEYMEEVYPALIDRFGEAFPHSQLQYYDP